VVRFRHPPAEICSCNLGIPAIHGGQKMLLHFRRTCHPWQ